MEFIKRGITYRCYEKIRDMVRMSIEYPWPYLTAYKDFSPLGNTLISQKKIIKPLFRVCLD
jgi:hypothetical protein